MAKEVTEYLSPAPGKVLVDCTLGGGGHTENLKLQTSNLKIFGFDQDEEALAAAKTRLAKYDDIIYIHDNFVNIKNHVQEKVDGILFDLGVSSYQIDAPDRGFSIREDGPLDMRMDKSQKLSAFDIVNTWSADDLTRIIKEYGEERFAKRISNAICVTRNAGEVKTTAELKAIIEKAIPTWKKRESVTRVFQALRIAVNSELDNLKKALVDSIELLKPGGRLVVISYHSLEDRIVKQLFRAEAKNGILKIMTKKPIIAGEEETKANPRSRSAKLRAAEKA